MKYSALMLDSRPSLDVEPSATLLLDSSRRHANGTFVGSGKPDWIRLPSGLWVMRFNGSDASISFTDSAYFDSILIGSFSFCSWLNFPQLSATSMSIFRKRSGANGYAFYHDSSAYISLVTGNGSASAFTAATTALKAGIWQFWLITLIKISPFYAYIYCNGVDVTSSHGAHASIAIPNLALYLGSTQGSASFFRGDMALPRIWNRALSTTEILAIFNNERAWFGV
jgi:hypothetical protein